MSELSDKLSGKAKQAAGRAADDKKLENEGKMEETRGKVKDMLGSATAAVSGKMEEAKRKLDK